MKVDKIYAFSLVIKALENNDEKTASAIMEIIVESIDKDKKNNKFSNQIEINNKKDEKYFENVVDEKNIGKQSYII